MESKITKLKKLKNWTIATAILIFSATVEAASPSPRLLVHLLDYLAKDYGGAVDQGQIISPEEYQEQVEFIENARKLNPQMRYLPGTRAEETRSVQARIEKLRGMILTKQDAEQVSSLAREVRDEVVRLAGISKTPKETPDLARGAQIYAQNCVSCHGANGAGDGPAAVALNPKPANFTDAQAMASASPLQAFHAIRLGVEGTGMVPFTQLSEQDTWNVAYFVLSFVPKNGGGGPDGSGGGAEVNPLKLARQKLEASAKAYQEGNADIAHANALAAYLEGVEPVEAKLRANDAQIVAQIEAVMTRVRQSIDTRKPVEEVDAAVKAAIQRIDEVDARLSGQEMSPWMAFSAASAVLLREGFEAVLLIIAFLGVVRVSGNPKAARWLHGGWIAAVGLGVVAWFFSGWMLAVSGAQRETMEAYTSFFAAAVLLFVGFWLHQKTEIGRWKAFIESRIKAALEKKSLFGLALISFIAVFRETMETVLFLRAIWVDCGPAAKTAMLSGVGASFVLTMVCAWMALRYSKRIPIRQMFGISSAMMSVLAVVLVGKGVHNLQESGALSITSTPTDLRWELFGLYPSWETVTSQLATVGLILILWAWSRRPVAAVVRSAQQV